MLRAVASSTGTTWGIGTGIGPLGVKRTYPGTMYATQELLPSYEPVMYNTPSPPSSNTPLPGMSGPYCNITAGPPPSCLKQYMPNPSGPAAHWPNINAPSADGLKQTGAPPYILNPPGGLSAIPPDLVAASWIASVSSGATTYSVTGASSFRMILRASSPAQR